jgi:hypothetical protein
MNHKVTGWSFRSFVPGGPPKGGIAKFETGGSLQASLKAYMLAYRISAKD